jgi:hypothetical protein
MSHTDFKSYCSTSSFISSFVIEEVGILLSIKIRI